MNTDTHLGISSSSFLELVTANDVSAVEQLLINGVNPDQRDGNGLTPLCIAVAEKHSELAACLLTYGASHRIPGPDGVFPLNPSRLGLAALHEIRQFYHRFPRRGQLPESSPDVQRMAEQFDRCGIIKLPQLVSSPQLLQIKSDFENFIAELDAMIAENRGHYLHYDEELHLWTKDKAYLSNNFFKYSEALIRLACHPTIVQIADTYVGKPVHVQRGVAMRYLPSERSSHDMFGWHHDMEERRIKAMVLLTDISDTDQYMSYLSGTNKIYHPLEMFYKNNSSPEYCAEHVGTSEMFKTIGMAGDVFMFDSNGTHRGNRSPEARLRDAVFIEYSFDKSQVWGGDIDPTIFDSLALDGRNPFDRMLRVEKKWRLPVVRGELTDWVHTLPHVDRWL